MVALELDDIQGNILRGYGFAQAAYLFFEVPDPASGRRFLGGLVDGVQDAAAWSVAPATATNIAVTYAGLRALGVPATVLDELPDAFRQPIRERAAQLLDDTGPSAPEHWVDGVGTERSHILVTVNGRGGFEHAFGPVLAAIRTAAADHGVALVHEQAACTLEHRREHFGWADGFSQPGIEGAPGPAARGDGVPQPDGTWRDLKAGEFVLGYPDEDGQTVAGPAAPLLRNGTFMVYRRLHQDVARFRRQLFEDARRYGATLSDEPPLDPDQLYELMAAKVVGRWRDGESVELTQRRAGDQSRNLGGQSLAEPSNDFRYAPDDKGGFKCPTGAHIRRTNPRDALDLDGGGLMSLRHRIIRRGMPYGPFLPVRVGQDDDGLHDDGQDRGLIFVCFNASLERQFETVQRQWCDDGNAFRLGNDKDYLLGDAALAVPAVVEGTPDPAPDGRVSTGRVTIPGEPPHFVHAEAPVVCTTGCEYLLMPGMASLRALARGDWQVAAVDPDAPPTGEEQAIARIVDVTRGKFEHDYAGGERPMRRDQHAKAHGCVRAHFIVGGDVPADLRHGIFREPATYPAWMRFSSSAGAPTPQPDTKRDAHGMAVKLMGVEGPKILPSEADATTQDFVLANSRVFFCRNAEDYVDLATRASQGRFLSFFVGWNPARWHLRELANVLVATRQKVDDPLDTQYWSQTPYALGPHVV
ncbi:MAG: catalase, partial [Actinomycetota bacterium]|nr:catalase [Actinomycetota bacterium]